MMEFKFVNLCNYSRIALWSAPLTKFQLEMLMNTKENAICAWQLASPMIVRAHIKNLRIHEFYFFSV
jgi:hypothetical protein